MNTPTEDVELNAMASIWAALQQLPDDEAKARSLNWALARLGLPLGHGKVQLKQPEALNPERGASISGPNHGQSDESYEDLFEKTSDGRFRVIARDLKAKSRNDAAIRLVYLVLFANEVLGQQSKTSSKKFVVPVLNEWRAYDGNTRFVLAHDPGIKRDGEMLSLDVHSRRAAQDYIAQIRDTAVKGTWSPNTAKKQKAAKAKD